MADFTEKTFSEYYAYFKNLNDFVEENSINDMPIPEHLEVCHTLRGDGDSDEYNLVVVELDKGDGTNGTWIGIDENLYQKIKPLEGNYDTFWNCDILFRQSKTSSCGCFGAAIDIKSVEDSGGNKNTPEFESSWQWRTPTGSGVTPNLDNYYFYEASSFPCENCVIPVAVNPNTYKNVEESKRGGGFITGIWYAHPIVSNPWVSCVANLKRFTYNTHDPSTHDWIVNELKMDQQNNCIDRQYIAWDPNDIGQENFTFKASVVFYKDKFKCTTYPMLEDEVYPLNITSTLWSITNADTLESCANIGSVESPYISSDEYNSGSITKELILSRWGSVEVSMEDSDITPEAEPVTVLIFPYFAIMAQVYDLCVTNYFDLFLDFLNRYRDKFAECIDAASGGAGGSGINKDDMNKDQGKFNKDKYSSLCMKPCYVSSDFYDCRFTGNQYAKSICANPRNCKQDLAQKKVNGAFGNQYPYTEEGLISATNDILKFYEINVKGGSSFTSRFERVQLEDGNLAIVYETGSYSAKPDSPVFNDVLEKIKADAANQQKLWDDAGGGRYRISMPTGTYSVTTVSDIYCVCGNSSTYLGWKVSCNELYEYKYTTEPEGSRPFFIGSFSKYADEILNSGGVGWAIDYSGPITVPLTEIVKIGDCDGYKTLLEDEKSVLGIQQQ